MWLDPSRNYDLIGDVHGCAQTLEHLLMLLGYKQRSGIWQHNSRQAIFLGDLIDRGPHIRETLHIVHSMVEAGHAHASWVTMNTMHWLGIPLYSRMISSTMCVNIAHATRVCSARPWSSLLLIRKIGRISKPGF